MQPIESVPVRVRRLSDHAKGTIVRTESQGVGRTRRPYVLWDDDQGGPRREGWLQLDLIGPVGAGEPVGLRVEGHTATLTEPPTERPKLGDVGKLIKERGLDPDEWVVVSTTLNEWDSLTAVHRGAAPRTVRLKQWKVVLRRAPHLVLALPAAHVPPVKRVPGPPKHDVPELIVVEGDHQVPYHDTFLHRASLNAISDLYKNHNLTEQVFLGDTLDLPTVSKYADHPAAMSTVNEGIQGGYDLLRAKREAAPNARARKLKGNHDWRLESELLARAERLYGIKPADTPENGPELPALSLNRLLHLPELGIELVEDPRGWEHGEVVLVDGPAGLVIRHGWLIGQSTAEKSLRARGRSLIVGHKHTREHVFEWDAGSNVERQAVVNGVMCLVRHERFPHFSVLDNWAQGFCTVTRWPSGDFVIDHAFFDGKTLTWRDKRWEA